MAVTKESDTLRKRGGAGDETEKADDMEAAAVEDSTTDADDEPVDIVEATWSQLVYHWFILGWTAFGGPAAHVGMVGIGLDRAPLERPDPLTRAPLEKNPVSQALRRETALVQ
jgi:hypothetical protein